MKKRMTKTALRHQPLFISLSGFYILVALIPVLTCIFTYSNVTNYLVRQEADKQTQQMQSGLEKLEDSLRSMESYAASTAQIPSVASFIAEKEKEQCAVRMLGALRELPNLNDSLSLISRFYLYSTVNGASMESAGGCMEMPLHYDARYKVGGLTYSEWERNVMNGSRSRYFYPSDTEKALVFIRAIQYKSCRSCFVFYYAENSLKALLGEDENTALVLCDTEGRVLMGDGGILPENCGVFSGFTEKNGRVITCVQSSQFGLALYLVTPKALLSRTALQLSMRIFLRVLPFLVLCIGVLVFVLSRSHHAVRETIKAIPDIEKKGWNPFRYLQQSVISMSEASAVQRMQLEKSRDELREATLSALLFSRDTSDDTMQRMLRENGLWFDADHYRVVTLELWNPETKKEEVIEERTHKLIMEITDEYQAQMVYLKMDGPKRMLFLLLFHDEAQDDTESCKRLCTGICMEIARAVYCEPRMKIGCVCHELTRVRHSYQSLHNLFSNGQAAEEYLMFAQEKPTPQFDYTRADDSRLIFLTRTGDCEGVQAHLDELYARNTGVHSLSVLDTQLLYAAMLGTLLETGYNGEMDRTIRYTLSEVKIDRFFELIAGYYTEQCRKSEQSARMEEKQLVSRLVQAVEEQYGDYSLNAEKLALQFSISVRGVSLLLRNEIGLGFPEYLEKVRIEHAVAALRDTDMKIDEIAVKVGYAGSDSFRRAFKRQTGQLPSAYRGDA